MSMRSHRGTSRRGRRNCQDGDHRPGRLAGVGFPRWPDACAEVRQSHSDPTGPTRRDDLSRITREQRFDRPTTLRRADQRARVRARRVEALQSPAQLHELRRLCPLRHHEQVAAELAERAPRLIPHASGERASRDTTAVRVAAGSGASCDERRAIISRRSARKSQQTAPGPAIAVSPRSSNRGRPAVRATPVGERLVAEPREREAHRACDGIVTSACGRARDERRDAGVFGTPRTRADRASRHR